MSVPVWIIVPVIVYCHSDGRTYLSPMHVQYLTIVSGWPLDRSWTEGNHVILKACFNKTLKGDFVQQ